jgi:hypothetical protein
VQGLKDKKIREQVMLEERMRLQADKAERLTERLNWSPQTFADALGIETAEAYKMLGGGAVNYYTAKRFIEYFKAPFAAAFIDFAAMGMKPPKFLRVRPIDETVLFGRIAKNITEKGKEKKAL